MTEKQSHVLDHLVERVQALTAQIQEYYLADKIPWVVGYSGGKDSTCSLQLVWNAVLAIPKEQRHKTIHVISTDTLVEQPVVAAWVRNSLEKIQSAAVAQDMPIEAHMLEPDPTQTFWVNLIGRGYPAPRHKFRWCTERLKINPSNNFITNVVRQSGEAILVLGTRKAESSKRAANMSRHEQRRLRDRLSPNSALPNSLIYSVIEDWTNDDVWLYLLQVKNPWGHSNRDLVSMYRGASADNECPLVVDTSTPTCGTSRFGCWVCTLVERDKSMEAMIENDEEKEWMLPLLELRNELDVDDDRHLRDFRRMNGRVQLFNGAPIHGPYLKQFREHWLRRVLETQTKVRKEGPEQVKNIELIRLSELQEIRRIWRTEKHEFDDAAPRIYKEVTGQDFPMGDELADVLGHAEWQLLEQACEGDHLLLDIASHLLDTEREYRAMSRRIGVINALEQVLIRRGFESKEHAIEDARHRAGLSDSENEWEPEPVQEKA
jgi:DNA sulfur modification protein DndC